jgi:hypothetical protein
LPIRPPLSANQNTRQTRELGTTVILAGFSTMGITCGKTLPAA